MNRFDLDAEQSNDIEKAFLSMPPQEGVKEKLELVNEKLLQTAKQLHTLSRKCPEQVIALRKLQEAQSWYERAIIKHGAK